MKHACSPLVRGGRLCMRRDKCSVEFVLIQSLQKSCSVFPLPWSKRHTCLMDFSSLLHAEHCAMRSEGTGPPALALASSGHPRGFSFGTVAGTSKSLSFWEQKELLVTISKFVLVLFDLLLFTGNDPFVLQSLSCATRPFCERSERRGCLSGDVDGDSVDASASWRLNRVASASCSKSS